MLFLLSWFVFVRKKSVRKPFRVETSRGNRSDVICMVNMNVGTRAKKSQGVMGLVVCVCARSPGSYGVRGLEKNDPGIIKMASGPLMHYIPSDTAGLCPRL